MLSQKTLPERLLTKCLDVLRVLSASERDLIRVMVEIIQDLRELGEEDDGAIGVSISHID
jgi:condensin complex subunit 3